MSAQVVEKVRTAGGLFIADEVQSGFGRMGSDMWGHRHHGVVPDFITIGKPAGNGHPLGVVMTRPEILEHFTGESAFFSTFGGNNVSCAAGIAVLDVIRDENLIDNARETGAYLKQGLRDLMKRHAIIGDVRGTGLALGMELVLDRKHEEPASKAQISLLNLVRDEGVLVGGEGACRQYHQNQAADRVPPRACRHRYCRNRPGPYAALAWTLLPSIFSSLRRSRYLSAAGARRGSSACQSREPSVMRETGTGSKPSGHLKRNSRRKVASSTVASTKAKDAPIQMRGPAPKGMNA